MQFSIYFTCAAFSILTLTGTTSWSQKGLPAKEPTSARVHTHYPQHDDFKKSDLVKLKLPNGFRVQLVASGLGKPRMLAVSDKGLYVTRRDQGDILLLQDKNGDKIFDELKTVMVQFKGVHGIALHEDYLYACSNRELKRAKIKENGDLETSQTLIDDLPDGGQHGNRTIYFGPDGKLYITVGSTCNDCNETNKENATILQANADGSERKIFARGLRNTIGIDWNPYNELWGADNGTDWRGDEIPPEEINHIKEGKHYGWPIVYGKQEIDSTREDPNGSTKAAFAKTTESMHFGLPAHSAPINFVFLTKAKKFPVDYQKDALVSLHGSWNRQQPDGYKVIRIHFENDKPVSSEDFFAGFLNKETNRRFGRPAGLVVTETGVYVSDDANGNIYFISYSN